MDYFSSDVFKVSLFIVIFLIAAGLVNYLIKDRVKNSFLAMSDEKKLRLHKTYPRLARIVRDCKVLLWILPLFWLVQIILDLIVHRYDSLFFDLSVGAVMYVSLLVAFLSIKMLLEAIGKS